MFIRSFILFIVCMLFFAPTTYAKNKTLKDKIKLLFYPNSTKSKPLQVKTIPPGAACSPEVPSDCNIKK